MVFNLWTFLLRITVNVKMREILLTGKIIFLSMVVRCLPIVCRLPTHSYSPVPLTLLVSVTPSPYGLEHLSFFRYTFE